MRSARACEPALRRGWPQRVLESMLGRGHHCGHAQRGCVRRPFAGVGGAGWEEGDGAPAGDILFPTIVRQTSLTAVILPVSSRAIPYCPPPLPHSAPHHHVTLTLPASPLPQSPHTDSRRVPMFITLSTHPRTLPEEPPRQHRRSFALLPPSPPHTSCSFPTLRVD